MPLKNKTRRALDFLRGVNKALEQAADEQTLLNDVCRIAVEVGGYRFAWVGYAMHDPEQSVRFMACAGHHPDYLERISISWSHRDNGQGPAGVAIRTGKADIIQHIRENLHFQPWLQAALDFGYESVIAVPLSWRGDNFGCLAILSAEPDSFDSDEAELLSELGASLSYGITALRTYVLREQAEAELRTERDAQEVLRSILSLSLEGISLEERLNRTLELLFDVPWLSLERKGSVFLADPVRGTLTLLAKRHLSPILREHCATVEFGHCLCGKAAAAGELQFHGHVDDDHEVRFDGIVDHGHYCQPIRSASGVIGLLNLYVGAGHEPQPIEASFLGAVADTLAGIIEREQAELAQRRLATILEATPDLVTITDTEGNCLYCNEGARQMLQLDRDSASAQISVLDHYPRDLARRLRDEVFPNAIAAGSWEGELLLQRPDGSDLPVSQLVMAHRNAQGQTEYLSTTARDISDRKMAEEAAKAVALRERHFANTIINSLPGVFYLTDGDGHLLRWNSNLEKTLGYSGDALQALSLRDLVAPEAWPEMQSACTEIMLNGSASLETALQARDGRVIPFYIHSARIGSREGARTIVGIGIDMSYRQRLEQELREQATTDPLTGAFNRLKMEETMERELRRCDRFGTPFSIAMFDIDHFKRVNDTYGHDAGDEVLRAVTEITWQQLREVDTLARWGGEEFAILAESTGLEGVAVLAERVRKAIAESPILQLETLTVSFGVGQYLPGEARKDFLKRVDDALYLAKKKGRDRVQLAGEGALTAEKGDEL